MAEPVAVKYCADSSRHGLDPVVLLNREAFSKFSKHVETSWVVEDEYSLQGAIKTTLIQTLAELDDQMTSDFMYNWRYYGVAPCSREHIRAAIFAWTWFRSDPVNCPLERSRLSEWTFELNNASKGEFCIVDKTNKRRRLVPDARETKDTT